MSISDKSSDDATLALQILCLTLELTVFHSIISISFNAFPFLNDETFENWTGHVVISEAEEELNIYIQKLKKARYDLASLDETYGTRNRLWYGMWTTFDEMLEMCDFYKCAPNGKDKDAFLRNKIKIQSCNYGNVSRGWTPYDNMIKYLNNSSLLKDLGLAGTIPVLEHTYLLDGSMKLH